MDPTKVRKEKYNTGEVCEVTLDSTLKWILQIPVLSPPQTGLLQNASFNLKKSTFADLAANQEADVCFCAHPRNSQLSWLKFLAPAQRTSTTNFLLFRTPAVDCQWSSWSQWSPCSASCGVGWQTSTRTVLQPSQYGGDPCEDTDHQTRTCIAPECGECNVWVSRESGRSNWECKKKQIPLKHETDQYYAQYLTCYS